MSDRKDPSDRWFGPFNGWLDSVDSIWKKLAIAIGSFAALQALIRTQVTALASGSWQVWIAFLLSLIPAGILTGLEFRQRLRDRRAQAAANAPVPEPNRKALIRGADPFEDGDALPGRDSEVQAIYTKVVHSDYHCGVLAGISGCGKTSLLWAGLVPRLRANFLPVYVRRPGNDPIAAVRAALSAPVRRADIPEGRDLGALIRAASEQVHLPLFVIFDEFEDFYVNKKTRSIRRAFIEEIGACLDDTPGAVRFLFCMRKDSLVDALEFAPSARQSLFTERVLGLENFDPAQAEEVLRLAAAADDITFSDRLIREVVADLTTETGILPAALQIVAEQMKSKGVNDHNSYEIAGRASRLLRSYVDGKINTFGPDNAMKARVMLRLFVTSEGGLQRSVERSLDEIVTATQDTDGPPIREHREQMATIVKRYLGTRMIMETTEGKLKLTHDFLVPYVAQATSGVETPVERADRLLRRYIAEYDQDSTTRIPWSPWWDIVRHASKDLRQAAPAPVLLARSERAFGAFAAKIILLVAVLSVAATIKITWDGGWHEQMQAVIAQPVPADGRSPTSVYGPMIAQVGFSPHGELAVVYNDCGVYPTEFWQISRGRRQGVTRLPPFVQKDAPTCGNMIGLAFSPDGKRFAFTDDNGVIHLWKSSADTYVDDGTLNFHPEPPPYQVGVARSFLAFNAKNTELLVYDQRPLIKEIRRWDLNDRATIPPASSPTVLSQQGAIEIEAVTFGNDGDPWAIVHDATHDIFQVWSLTVGKGPLYTFQNTMSVQWDQSRNIFIVRGKDGRICLEMQPDMPCPDSLKGLEGLHMAISPDGNTFVTASGQNVRISERGVWIWGRRRFGLG